MPDKTFNYKKLSQELETILLELRDSDLDVDDVVTKYKRGVEIINLLQKHLKEAETKIIKIN